jgi:hypothetical protein
MTASHNNPVDPHLVAEVAPGEGPEPGSVEYGGSEISGVAGGRAGADTERLEDLPVTSDDHGATGD